MILSKSEYISSINVLLKDNSTQEISPADVRNSLIDLVDSVHNFLDNKEINTYNFSSPDVRTTRGGDLALGKMDLVGRTSVDNSAYGYYALGANYTGSENTALGSHALGCNLMGTHNVGVGYNAVAGNVTGSGNVGVGNFSLQTSKKGSFNIAIGHGAGHYIGEDSSHNFYVAAFDGLDADSLCDIQAGSGDPPLLFGDLKNRKLGVGVKTLHNFGELQVSGDIAPYSSGLGHVGRSSYSWKSVNEVIYFSGGKVGFGTSTPSGDQGLVTVKGHIVPEENGIYALGYSDGTVAGKKLLWDGYFNDLVVSGMLHANDVNYNHINECLYDCKTLHLATSGFCDTEGLGFHNSSVWGYLSDEALDGAGFEVHSSGYDYRRDYRFIYKFPDPNITCLEEDSHFARSRWHSNISLHIESGKHLQTDRVLGKEKLALVTQSGCFGLFMRNYQPTTVTHPHKNRLFVGDQAHANANYSDIQDVNFISRSGLHPSSGVDFSTLYGSVDSGVKISVMLGSRLKTSLRGFSIQYHDEEDK